MSSTVDATETLDVQGHNCPMPVVKTKQAVDELEAGSVLEVLATDPGSVSDIAGWAESDDEIELVEQSEDGEIYRHYLKRTA